jgi:superfamily I DNA/RNA helicase
MNPLGLIHVEDWSPSGIEGLEDEAMSAVRATGNTLVTAGPGAGKTELLGQRGVFLLQTGACPYPRRLLAISYKRDAARNLRTRFQSRCSKEQAGRLDSMTFDAFSKLILDRFWRALPESWQLTTSYRVNPFVTRQEFQDFQRSSADGLKDPGTPAGWAAVHAGLDVNSNQIYGVNQDAFNLGIHELILHPLKVPDVAAFLQLAYLRRMFGMNPVPLTFQMIGRLAQLIVETNHKIRAAILATYSHLFMDEFQDASGVQYGLIKSIFDRSDTIVTAVGDDKQRIMGWAGAHKNSFGLFTADFLKEGAEAGQRHITLALNYRSNARIVEILNILKRRLAPHEPDFRAARPAPALPPEQICSVILSPNSEAEAEALGAFIASEIKQGLPPRTIGLLVRQKAANSEAALGPVFARHKVILRNEDRDVGGASIQDLMTEPYAQTVTDGLELLLRKRGGVVWIRALEALSDMEGLAPDEEHDRVAQIAVRLDDFHLANRIDDPEQPATAEDILARLERVEVFFGLAALKASAPQYQQGDFFDRIRKATKSYLAECAAGGVSWRAALARYRGDNQIPLLTITKSKGLEYDMVVLLGLDDEQWWSFPRNPDEGHATFFVAASRARERLFMTLCEDKPRGKLGDVYKLLNEAGVKGLKIAALLRCSALTRPTPDGSEN